jgi:hypothetical protein
MSVMRARIMALEVDGQSGNDHFGDEAILRYSDPTRRITDASVWRLGRSGRPRAIVVLEVYSSGSIQMEPTAIADPPEQLKGNGWQWSPRGAAYEWTPIPAERRVAESTEQMQRKIRQLSRKFTAEESFRGQTYQLRLLPKPLLQYTDAAKGVEAGMVFAWAHGTNVESLMLIEAQKQSSGPPLFVAGFSRLGAASLALKFDRQPFWAAPEMPRPSATSPYYYRMISMTPAERQAFTE